MKNHHIIYPLFILILLITSCSSENNTQVKDEVAEQHEHENSNTVSMTPMQMKAIGLQFGTIEQKQLTASLKASGFLKVPNQNKASITSMYGGVIRSISVQPGNSVRKGQSIATVANPQLITLQEEYLSLESRVKYAQLEFNRQKELSGNNSGALKNFQQSETELSTLQIRKASLKKQLELIGVNTAKLSNDNIQSVITITSPVTGTVSRVMANIGSNVDLNSPIAEVVDNSQLHLDLFVYEKDLPKVKVGQIIHFTLTNNPGREYDAEIFGIGNTFEDASKALAVHATVKGDKVGLIEGMSITALVSLENATVQAVPTESIVNYQGRDYVFIATDANSEDEHHSDDDGDKHDEHNHSHATDKKREPSTSSEHSIVFERIPVRVGTTDVGYSEITLLKEIPSNSRIVTKGAFFLLAKMTNSGEHEH